MKTNADKNFDNFSVIAAIVRLFPALIELAKKVLRSTWFAGSFGKRREKRAAYGANKNGPLMAITEKGQSFPRFAEAQRITLGWSQVASLDYVDRPHWVLDAEPFSHRRYWPTCVA